MKWQAAARFLKGVGAEVRDILRALPLLRWPFWLAGVGLLTLIAVLPGNVRMPAYAAALIAVGMAGVLSGRLARWLRRLGWVKAPEGEVAVSSLPPLLIVLMFPLYFAVMTALFWSVGEHYLEHFPGIGAGGVRLALLTALDNLLRCQLFFDTFEIFEIRLGAAPETWQGMTMFFVSRLLMDIAFAKLIVQVFVRAMVYRSAERGRGEERLYKVVEALSGSAVSEVRQHCTSISNSLHAAVRQLQRHAVAGGTTALQAFRGLHVMREFAIPSLEAQLRTTVGPGRDQLISLVDRLSRAPVEHPKAHRPAADRKRLILLLAGLILGAGLPFLLPPLPALIVSILVGGMLAWMLVRSRRWIDRLVAWRAMRPVPPDRLFRVMVLWALFLAPLLVLTAANLFLAVENVSPGMFAGGASRQIDYLSSLTFAGENLLRIQLFADIFEIYEIQLARLKAGSLLAGLMVLATRVTFDLGVIGLILATWRTWINRFWRRFPVTPHAIHRLEIEAETCGPQCALQIGYYYHEIRHFLIKSMREHADRPELIAALAASGFLPQWQKHYGNVELATTADAERHLRLGERLRDEDYLEEAAFELDRAVAVYERLNLDGPDEFRDQLARAKLEYTRLLDEQERYELALEHAGDALKLTQELDVDRPDIDMRGERAAIRLRMGRLLRRLHRFDEAVAQTNEAIELYQALPEDDLRRAADIAAAYSDLANIFRDQHKGFEAIAQYRRCIEIYRGLVDAGHEASRDNLAAAHMGLGLIYTEQDQHEQAAAELGEAIERFERLVFEGYENVRDSLARCRLKRGFSLRLTGHLQSAAGEFDAAITAYAGLLLKGRRDVLDDLVLARRELARTFGQQGDASAARAAFEETVTVLENAIGNGSVELRVVLAEIYDSLGSLVRPEDPLLACSHHQTAIDLFEEVDRERPRDTLMDDLALAYAHLGIAQREAGQTNSAANTLKEAEARYLELVEQGRDDLRVKLAQTWQQLRLAFISAGRRRQGIEPARRAAEMYERLVAEHHIEHFPDHAMARQHLGDDLFAEGQFEQALVEYRRAAPVLLSLLQRADPLAAKLLPPLLDRLGDCVREVGPATTAVAELSRIAAQLQTAVQQGNASARFAWAVARNELAEALVASDTPHAAERELAAAVELIEQLVGEGEDLEAGLAAMRGRLELLKSEGPQALVARPKVQPQTAPEVEVALGAPVLEPVDELPPATAEIGGLAAEDHFEIGSSLTPTISPSDDTHEADDFLALEPSEYAAADAEGTLPAANPPPFPASTRDGELAERFIARIDRLGDDAPSPTDFFRDFLKLHRRALQARAAGLWTPKGDGTFHCAGNDGLERAGRFGREETLDRHAELVRRAADTSRAVVLAVDDALLPADGETESLEGKYPILLAPILIHSHVAAVVEIVLPRALPAAKQHAALEAVTRTAQAASEFLSARTTQIAT